MGQFLLLSNSIILIIFKVIFMNFSSIQQCDNDNIMPTYKRFPIALDKGSNATAYDYDGKKYIDFTSGIGVNSLGYCDEGWIKAVTEQASRIQHTSNLFYNKTQTDLAEKLCKATGYSKVFLANSGAEANECAIKLARKYSYDKYCGERYKILSLVNSFHGRTVTTLSATGQEHFHDYFFPFTDGFAYVPANDYDALKAAADGKVCAVMIECIQGEGGLVPLDEEYVQKVRSMCSRRDILLIIDEVQTGIGRTGKLLCQEHFGIQGDITTTAKGIAGGLPMGACLCNEKLAATMDAGTHGSTFGGNPVACAAASYVLDRIGNEEFLNEVAKKGEWIKEQLAQIPQLSNIRGMGMMIGADCCYDAGKVVNECVNKGLLLLTAKKSLRLLPPLTITYDELNEGLTILKEVLAGFENE